MPEFNADIFETLFEEENKNDEAKQAAYAKLDAAKASKDSAQIAAMKNEIKALTNEGYVIKGKIKQATRDNTKYNHAIKPYADAQKLIKQSENYGRFVEIEELYEAARIDGVRNRFQEIIYITIPAIKPHMMFGAIMAIVNAFQNGSIGVQLSGANPTPGYAGQLLVTHAEEYAFGV